LHAHTSKTYTSSGKEKKIVIYNFRYIMITVSSLPQPPSADGAIWLEHGLVDLLICGTEGLPVLIIHPVVLRFETDIMQTLRTFAPLSVAILIVSTVVSWAIWLWIEEGLRGPSCTKFRGGITGFQDIGGLVELSLKSQDVEAPSFGTGLYLWLEKPPKPSPIIVTVKRSSEGIYGIGTVTFALLRDWSNPEGPQFSPGYQEIGLLSRTGRHRNFPFDGRSFDFTLDFDSDLSLDAVKLTNRIAGFYIPCDDTATIIWISAHQL
jgi:hypothetical protein